MKKHSKSSSLVVEVKFDNIVYKRLRDIPGYSDEALGKTFFYIKIENYMNSGNDAYIRCTKQQAYDYRNLQRNTKRSEHSYNKHIGNYIEPLDRMVIDEKGNTTIIEYPDNNFDSSEDYALKEHLKAAIRRLVYTRDTIDQQIYECIIGGDESDSIIAKKVGRSRSVVQERRTKLISWLANQLKDYQ